MVEIFLSATDLLYLPVLQSPSEGYGNFTRENYNITGVGAPGIEGRGVFVCILRDLIKYFNGLTKSSLISHKV